MPKIKSDPDVLAMGDNIRCKREERGWSQDALAIAVDTSKNTIHRIESGQQTMKVDKLMRISDALEEAPWEFFPSRFDKYAAVDSRLLRLGGMMKRLPEEKREIAYQAMESMLRGMLV